MPHSHDPQPEINAWLHQKASGWLQLARGRADLLAGEAATGWQLQSWGANLFGCYPGHAPAALLVYIPPGRAARANLAALLAAAQAWQNTAGELPVTLKFLTGPLAGDRLAAHATDLAATALVYAEGEYQQGRPLLALGLKGLLEVELRATTLAKDAPAAYSETMPAASWLLIRGLATLKSDAQEVQIEDFEAGLDSVPAEESMQLLKATPGFSPALARRLKDYGLDGYIFNLNDRLVLQTEFMVPTVNVSTIEVGSFGFSGRLKLPATARARLDFHLVPFQDPDWVFTALEGHFAEKDFGPQLEIIRLPGSLRPSRTPMTAPFVRAAVEAAQAPLVAPISAFSGPLALLKEAIKNPPAICGGLDRLNRADFQAQANWLARLFTVVPEELESYPDRSASLGTFADHHGDDFELPDLPDLSLLIPELPETESDLFGSVPEH